MVDGEEEKKAAEARGDVLEPSAVHHGVKHPSLLHVSDATAADDLTVLQLDDFEALDEEEDERPASPSQHADVLPPTRAQGGLDRSASSSLEEGEHREDERAVDERARDWLGDSDEEEDDDRRRTVSTASGNDRSRRGGLGEESDGAMHGFRVPDGRSMNEDGVGVNARSTPRLTDPRLAHRGREGAATGGRGGPSAFRGGGGAVPREGHGRAWGWGPSHGGNQGRGNQGNQGGQTERGRSDRPGLNMAHEHERWHRRGLEMDGGRLDGWAGASRAGGPAWDGQGPGARAWPDGRERGREPIQVQENGAARLPLRQPPLPPGRPAPHTSRARHVQSARGRYLQAILPEEEGGHRGGGGGGPVEYEGYDGRGENHVYDSYEAYGACGAYDGYEAYDGQEVYDGYEAYEAYDGYGAYDGQDAYDGYDDGADVPHRPPRGPHPVFTGQRLPLSDTHPAAHCGLLRTMERTVSRDGYHLYAPRPENVRHPVRHPQPAPRAHLPRPAVPRRLHITARLEGGPLLVHPSDADGYAAVSAVGGDIDEWTGHHLHRRAAPQHASAHDRVAPRAAAPHMTLRRPFHTQRHAQPVHDVDFSAGKWDDDYGEEYQGIDHVYDEHVWQGPEHYGDVDPHGNMDEHYVDEGGVGADDLRCQIAGNKKIIAPPTLEGWKRNGQFMKDGRAFYAGLCTVCSSTCRVPFRPVVGGNPPVCSTCADNKGTLEGWAPAEQRSKDGSYTDRTVFAGKCTGCGLQCQVPFRPVVGGKPPKCRQCHDHAASRQSHAPRRQGEGIEASTGADPFAGMDEATLKARSAVLEEKKAAGGVLTEWEKQLLRHVRFGGIERGGGPGAHHRERPAPMDDDTVDAKRQRV